MPVDLEPITRTEDIQKKDGTEKKLCEKSNSRPAIRGTKKEKEKEVNGIMNG
jgi:hypothetical protein